MVRSIIGELLHTIPELGGRVVSVTTDGFITDIDDLENKVLEYNSRKNVFSLLSLVRE